MKEMNNKYNETKNTSESNWNKIRAKEKAITNTRDLFRDSSTKLYVPAFTAWRISLYTKKLLQRNYKVYIRPGVHNSNLQFTTQEVAHDQWTLQALDSHKDYKFSPYNF